MQNFIKNIIKNLIYYCALSLIFISFTASEIYYPDSPMYYSNHFNNEDLKDTIVLGNSRSLCSIPPSQNVRHLGYSSGDISLSRVFLETVASPPKVLFLEVSWFTFNDSRTHFHDISGYALASHPSLIKDVYRYRNLGIMPSFLSVYRAEFERIFRRKKTNVDFEKKKFERDTLNYTGEMNTAELESFLKNFPDSLANITPRLLDDFNWIVDYSIENDVRLVLYTSPESEQFSLMQRDRDLVREVFKGSAEHKNVVFLDFSPAGELYDEHFISLLNDSHHLKLQHREYFFKYLKVSLDSILNNREN